MIFPFMYIQHILFTNASAQFNLNRSPIFFIPILLALVTCNERHGNGKCTHEIAFNFRAFWVRPEASWHIHTCTFIHGSLPNGNKMMEKKVSNTRSYSFKLKFTHKIHVLLRTPNRKFYGIIWDFQQRCWFRFIPFTIRCVVMVLPWKILLWKCAKIERENIFAFSMLTLVIVFWMWL